eukprot:CAMPEP_0196698144 /NCGR_PEP_ID=MMETSP1090-20130531/43830_1 /TAXON_ID=37098 /ORGANISM="Isochrysis sp, Strain CCMP1244" /LENGTH=42 /DNA_ID= /DNA_START= /DNA_END= /DNA_ORIENTATION=
MPLPHMGQTSVCASSPRLVCEVARVLAAAADGVGVSAALRAR